MLCSSQKSTRLQKIQNVENNQQVYWHFTFLWCICNILYMNSKNYWMLDTNIFLSMFMQMRPFVEYFLIRISIIINNYVVSVGPSQREPALKLASVMVQVCGIYSIQPPYTHDFKLFLLTTHLCCVEVRMILEDADLTLVSVRIIAFKKIKKTAALNYVF